MTNHHKAFMDVINMQLEALNSALYGLGSDLDLTQPEQMKLHKAKARAVIAIADALGKLNEAAQAWTEAGK
jgi:hypothetical protein